MSDKLMDGMTRAYWNDWCDIINGESVGEITAYDRKDMQAAVRWLADNVTDEMALAAWKEIFPDLPKKINQYAFMRKAIADALLKACEQ